MPESSTNGPQWSSRSSMLLRRIILLIFLLCLPFWIHPLSPLLLTRPFLVKLGLLLCRQSLIPYSCILVPRPKKSKVIGVRWVYKTKYHTVHVVKGYSQRVGVEFDETCPPYYHRHLLAIMAGLFLIWKDSYPLLFLEGTDYWFYWQAVVDRSGSCNNSEVETLRVGTTPAC